MKEKDNSRIYIKYKDNKRVVKIKSKELTRGCGFYVDEDVEEIIIENCYLDGEIWLTTMNADTKIIFRNCAFDKLFVENGKVYLTDINATYIKGINNKSFALKENNEINMDMKIKAETVLISGDLKEANTEIEAEKVIISSAVIDTFFDFFVRTKKLNISNSEFKSSSILSLDYQQALVTETSFDTHIFKVNGRFFKTDDEKISIYNNDPNKEEYIKSYLWLEFLRSLRDKVKAINEKDYKESCQQIATNSKKRIEEYENEIKDYELKIEKLKSRINDEKYIRGLSKIDKDKVLSKRKIGSIEGVVEKKPQQ